MRRSPQSLRILTIIGVLLAIWSTVNGVYILWFGGYLPSLPILLWYQAPDAHTSSSFFIQIQPERVAWPLLVLGLTWPGALISMWMGLRWGSRLVTVLLVLSIPVLGLGTLMAGLGWVCFATAGTRRWLRQQVDSHAI
ncbi:MAG: hypothetical protein GTO14_09450 [Anaerolineales bacterium]|nr:hypothetical protein [Anaerolineales bacterium]